MPAKKSHKIRTYQVIIPYLHKFTVKAATPREALSQAHNGTGSILGFEDARAEITEVQNDK